MQRGVLGPSTCLRGAFAIAVRRCRQGAQNGCSALPWCCQCTQKGCSGCLSLIRCRQGDQNGSKRFKNAQKGAKRLKKALEKAVRACPVPPVRSKRLFEPASVPPVRSKRLFESAVQDHSSKRLDSATLCSAPLCSALLSPCMYMHGSTLVYNLYKCSRSGPRRSRSDPGVLGFSLLRLKNTQKHVNKGSERLKMIKRAAAPPVRSKRLFESAVQDHSLKKLDSATLCSAPLCSALLTLCMDMHGSTLVYI